MATLDEEIARHLREAAAAGELSKAEGYGKPEELDWAWDATPAALRMPFKVLKDAGFAPPEVLLFQERGQLATAVRECSDDAQREVLQRQLSELEQKIALRLESLRTHSQL
ncbi:MAG: DUF1992 domain-containing protein [Betaproteobacteria bacterium]|nr:DUF1992 domain-containing protein [Betaproteobacteria bacterium]